MYLLLHLVFSIQCITLELLHIILRLLDMWCWPLYIIPLVSIRVQYMQFFLVHLFLCSALFPSPEFSLVGSYSVFARIR